MNTASCLTRHLAKATKAVSQAADLRPVQTGRCVKIGFPIGDADPQSIALTIPTLEQSMPEVIPADQVAEARKTLKDWEGIDMEWHIVDHGAYPEWKKLPAGMSEQEAYRKFIGALGYIYNGQWEFNLQLNPQDDPRRYFPLQLMARRRPIPLPHCRAAYRRDASRTHPFF